MSLKSLIKSKVTIISISSSLHEAAQLMLKDHVGSVIVVDNKKGEDKVNPVGIITDRDIALAIGAMGFYDKKIAVSEFMSKNVVLCSDSDGLFETIKKMKSNGVRRIPVVDKHNSLIGIITADDIFQLLSSELSDLSSVVNTEQDYEKEVFKGAEQDHQILNSEFRHQGDEHISGFTPTHLADRLDDLYFFDDFDDPTPYEYTIADSKNSEIHPVNNK